MVVGLLLCGFCACDRASLVAGDRAEVEAVVLSEVRAARSGDLVLFEGACDASGAVPIDERHFVVADDEDSVLRVYDAWVGGPPKLRVDLSEALGLEKKGKGKPKKGGRKRKKKSLESDIEAGARIGSAALFLTSHARTKSGKRDPNRFRFFATDVPAAGRAPKLIGSTETLLDEMFREPRFDSLELRDAAELPVKTAGALNIEGMTATPEGGLLIAFRSPQPGGRALVVPLLNPLDVLAGGRAQFSEPELLDLGGLGVRALSSWHGRYLIVGGATDSERASRLYVWERPAAPREVAGVDLRDFNAEGFFTPEERQEMLLLSDDGARWIGVKPCKSLADPEEKRFRGLRVRLDTLHLGDAAP